MVKGVYGINIAVSDLEKAVAKFQSILGVEPAYLRDEDFAFPNLTGAQFVLSGFVLNIIASRKADTSIAKFVEKRGDGVFLLSLAVDNIEEDVRGMKEKGLEFVTDVLEVPLGKVAFVHPKSLSTEFNWRSAS